MRRAALLASIILSALFIGGFHEWSTAHAAGDTCANSFPADGHGGPWRTTNNGGTLHGNTVKIDCPTQSTHWDINYRIQIVGGPGCPCDELNVHRSGTGDLQTSFSLSPYSCNIFQHRTHVDNNVTGGNINKPSGGSGTLLTCG
jgi:hypothetical protein